MEEHIRRLFSCLAVITVIRVVIRGISAGETTPEEPQLIPIFVPVQTNFTFNRGELAILYCSVENLGTKTVVWRRTVEKNPLTIGDYTFVNDDRINVGHRKGSKDWNLLIKNVQLRDSGTYECQISTKARDIRQKIYLEIKDEETTNRTPDIQIHGNAYVEKGDTIVLTCNATGTINSPDTVDWFKGGHKVVTDYDQEIFVRKNVSLKSKTIASTLKIRHARMEDTGTYICRTSDLQITKLQVNVLNANTFNVKRVADTIAGKNSDVNSIGDSQPAVGYNSARPMSANCLLSNIRLLITTLSAWILHERIQFGIK